MRKKRALAAMVVGAVILATGGLVSAGWATFTATTGSATSFAAAANFEAGQIYASGRALGTLVPRQLGSATWTQAAEGNFHACGIQTGGTLWCWGSNTAGQLGQGDTTYRYDPTQVGAATWTQVAAGGRHTCAIKTGGTLWCWGDNTYGQLGQNNTTTLLTPAQVGSASWTQVATGGTHTCGLQADATLWCWGQNQNGQTADFSSLGNPDLQPVKVTSSGAAWRAVATGTGHTCAVRTDNTLYCFGDGSKGQLGNTFVFNSVGQVQVPGTTWLTPYAGAGHTCATKTDNTLSCWGGGGTGLGGDARRAPDRQQPHTPSRPASADTFTDPTRDEDARVA